MPPKKGKEPIAEVYDSVTDGLKALYRTKIRPVEEQFKFGEFYSPIMNDGDFDAKPMVLLVGQYSVGKTSFIRYLLGRDFPGQHIGPEPTTDRFIAVMHGTDDKTTPGNALAVSPNMPFRGLEMFGNGFLSKFQGAQLDVPLLHHVTLIDTPGILAGEKQRIGRSYDFTQVCEWFASRCDIVLLLFDAHKLDISDEFQRAIEALKGHDDKIRVVLNKADQVDAQKLVRIYGALMWSLGKVIKTPECVRVYIGSFWDEPLKCNEWSRQLLQKEMADLLNDLKNVPKNAALRKVNELVKRVRLCTAHVYVIGHLKKEMP
jgi:EH domain-containing protein 1